MFHRKVIVMALSVLALATAAISGEITPGEMGDGKQKPPDIITVREEIKGLVLSTPSDVVAAIRKRGIKAVITREGEQSYLVVYGTKAEVQLALSILEAAKAQSDDLELLVHMVLFGTPTETKEALSVLKREVQVGALVPLANLTPLEAQKLVANLAPDVRVVSAVQPTSPEFKNLPRSQRDTETLLLPRTNQNGSPLDEESDHTPYPNEKAPVRTEADVIFGGIGNAPTDTVGGGRAGSALRSVSKIYTPAMLVDALDRRKQFATAENGTFARALLANSQASVLLLGPEEAVLEAASSLFATQQPPAQIQLEARVLELTPEAIEALGVKWAKDDGELTKATIKESNPSDVTRFGRFTRDGFAFAPEVYALMSRNLIRQWANPAITVTDGKQAEIFLGETGTFTNATRLTQASNGNDLYLVGPASQAKFGVQLYVTPLAQISDQTVTVKLVTSIGTRVFPTTGNLTQLTQARFRKAETTVRLQSGSLLAIGGLRNDEELERTDRVPLLGDIPIIRELFTRRRKESRHTEFVILFGARIIKDTVLPEKVFQEPAPELRLDGYAVKQGGRIRGTVRLDRPISAGPQDVVIELLEGSGMPLPDESIKRKETLHLTLGYNTPSREFKLRAPKLPPDAASQPYRVRATAAGQVHEVGVTIIR